MADTHLLIINPTEPALRLAKAGVVANKQKFLITVVITKDSTATLAPSAYNCEVIDLKTTEWDTNRKFISAIAYDFGGQKFLEEIQDQILLNNKTAGQSRLNRYYRSKPPIGCKIVETLSFLGRHIVVSCLVYKADNKIELLSHFDESWTELVEQVFENLDANQIINGSTQTYIDAGGISGVRMHPSNLTYTLQKQGTERHWFDVWPTVLMMKESRSNFAFRKFYEWTLETGPTSKIYNAKPLVI